MDKDSYSNLDRETRWLGIIDYKSLTVLIVYIVILWNILGFIVTSIVTKTYITVILVIPVLGLFYSNRSSESVVDVIYIVLRYLIFPKTYVYKMERISEINLVK